jgi:hypothetical protein
MNFIFVKEAIVSIKRIWILVNLKSFNKSKMKMFELYVHKKPFLIKLFFVNGEYLYEYEPSFGWSLEFEK